MVTIEEYLENSYELEYLIDGLEEGMVDMMVNRVEQAISTSKVNIQNRLSGFKEFLYGVGSVQFPKELKSATKHVMKSSTSYTDIRHKQTAKVIGLEKRLIVLSNVTYDFFQKSTNKEAFKMLDNLDTLIAKLASKKSERMLFRHYPKLDVFEDEFVKQPKEALRNIINPANKLEFCEVSKLIGSTSELVETMTQLNEINKFFTDKDILKLNKYVNKLDKRFNLLFNEILTDENSVMTKEALSNLTQMVKIYGDYLTGVSMFFFYYTKASEVAIKLSKFYK